MSMFNPEMLAKMQDLKAKAEESKAKLGQQIITEESGGGLIRVSMNGNRMLTNLEINTDLNSIDKDDLEDLLSVAIKRTLEKIESLQEQEMISSAQSLFGL